MTVQELIGELSLAVLSGQAQLEQQITGGYVSDLLSNVMGHTVAGNVWVTMQAHQNVVAVASLAGLAAVIIAGGVEAEAGVIARAEKENVVLLATPLPAFEVVGRLYRQGIQGV
ncbi:drtgg [Lucifera butyrica]|uniref:Drtgg n=1 Tax=Lucifera butyrica TaxID=1351585 RepID=A0A498R816_9FIRM|nr:DRTGG domain-containing protein [Lucifera butyrica]VBB06323.1 drtgg [Lucifera butyrica]